MWTTIKAGLFKGGTLLKATGLAATLGVIEMLQSKRGRRMLAVLVLGAATAAFVLARPIRSIPPGTAAVRVNRMTGGMAILDEGWALAIPGLHEFRTYPLHDQVYRPDDAAKATGAGAFQSIEGLSLGVDVSVRWALDPAKMSQAARLRPEELEHDLVQPTVDGALHRAFAMHTVREIFASARAPIQKGLEDELRATLEPEGIVIKAVAIGSIDLPVQYKAGLEALLGEELASDKMKYTLELKEKGIKQADLEAQADKVRRETAATAAGNETVIAAKAQEEAMLHILPLKEKEIEEKRLEAEAAKVTRIKVAEVRRRAPHRGRRRVRRAAQARRQRRVSTRRHGQGDHRADGPRGGPPEGQPAPHPEDPRRQARRQDPGDHRAAEHERLLRERSARRRRRRPSPRGPGRPGG